MNYIKFWVSKAVCTKSAAKDFVRRCRTIILNQNKRLHFAAVPKYHNRDGHFYSKSLLTWYFCPCAALWSLKPLHFSKPYILRLLPLKKLTTNYYLNFALLFDFIQIQIVNVYKNSEYKYLKSQRCSAHCLSRCYYKEYSLQVKNKIVAQECNRRQ